jgi:hypothetical protein
MFETAGSDHPPMSVVLCRKYCVENHVDNLSTYYRLKLMTTTTIRVDTETHRQLLELGEASGVSLIDTVRAATEALRRQRFGQQVADEMAAMRQDAPQWDAYLAEAEVSEGDDGIG